MKKIYLICCLFLALGATNAQTTLTTATDFTVTDTHGNSHNLYSILASGKYVCLDFFFTTCGPCQATCPYYKQTFTNYGCNTQDVYFMSIDMGNTNAEVDAYEVTYLGGSSGYPAISGTEGGGNAVVTDYGITAFPTYILIAPDHTVLEGDMWPISSAASFDTYFSSHSLAYKACATGITEKDQAFSLSMYPNPATTALTVAIGAGESIRSIKVMDVMGKLVRQEEVDNVQEVQLSLEGMNNAMYYVEVLSSKGSRVIQKIVKE